MATDHLITIAIDESNETPVPLILESIHRLVPGSHTVEHHELKAEVTDFEWDEHDGLPSLPMGPASAEALMDEDGFVTVVVRVPQSDIVERLFEGVFGDYFDVIHAMAFGFGVTDDSSLQILAAQGMELLISYSTRISRFVGDAAL